MPLYVAVAAYSRAPPPAAAEGARRFVGALSRGCGDEVVLLVGGYEGLMKLVVDEALGRGLRVVILPPLEQEGHGFPPGAVVIKTGVTFTVRSSMMAHASDVLVSLGGGVGSLEEILTAHNEGKPVLVLAGTGLPTDLVKSLPPRLDERASSVIMYFESPEAVAEEVCRWAARRTR